MSSLTNSSCFYSWHISLFPVYTLISPARNFTVDKYFFLFSLPNLDHLTIEI